jgi:hypothetical protein
MIHKREAIEALKAKVESLQPLQRDTVSTREVVAAVVPLLRAKGYDWGQAAAFLAQDGITLSQSTLVTYLKKGTGKRKRRSREPQQDRRQETGRSGEGQTNGESAGDAEGDGAGEAGAAAEEKKASNSGAESPSSGDAGGDKEGDAQESAPVRPAGFPGKINLDDL